MGRMFFFLFVSLFAFASVASADDPKPADGQPEFGVMPMASEGSDRKLERRLARQSRPKQDRRRSSPSGVLAIHGGVPIFVGDDIDRDIVRPGGSFAFLGGVDFGYGALEAEVGFTGVPLDLGGGIGRELLKRVHLSFGGRLQIPNDSILIPYLGGSFAFQWWKLDAGTGCTLIVCSTGNGFRFAPGLNFRGGVTIALGERFGLDIGLRYNLTFEGNDVFLEIRHWLEPSIGFRIWL